MNSNPFPGLRPFEKSESRFFFGRDKQSRDLLDRLQRTHFAAVIGVSGSGKSSLVRAGLLPLLEGGNLSEAGALWLTAVMKPGSDPIRNLAYAIVDGVVSDESKRSDQYQYAEATLRRGSLGISELMWQLRSQFPDIPEGANLLIVADQFEEIFRIKEREVFVGDDAAAFVKLLLNAKENSDGSIYTVITMRSEYIGDCAQFLDLPEAIDNGQYLIPRLNRDERYEAIVYPIELAGGSIDEALAMRLINEVGDNPDRLPILQHLLMRMWDHAPADPKKAIGMDDYDAVGGMANALSQHANEAFDQLPAPLQQLAKKVFLCLVTIEPDKGTTVRRPVTLKEITKVTGGTTENVCSVLDAFRSQGRTFITPFSGPIEENTVIDISHESLISGWKRFGEWVDQESNSIQLYTTIAKTAHSFGSRALYEGLVLQDCLRWYEREKPTPAWGERYHAQFKETIAFLIASEKEWKRKKIVRRGLPTVGAILFGALIYLYFGMRLASSHAAESERLKRVADSTSKVIQGKMSRVDSEQRLNAEIASRIGAMLIISKKITEISDQHDKDYFSAAFRDHSTTRDHNGDVYYASPNDSTLKLYKLLIDTVKALPLLYRGRDSEKELFSLITLAELSEQLNSYRLSVMERLVRSYNETYQKSARVDTSKKEASGITNKSSLQSQLQGKLHWYRNDTEFNAYLKKERIYVDSVNKKGSDVKWVNSMNRSLQELDSSYLHFDDNFTDDEDSSDIHQANYENGLIKLIGQWGNVYEADFLVQQANQTFVEDDSAITFLQRAASIYNTLNLSVKEAVAYDELGLQYSRMDSLEQCLREYRKSIALYTMSGHQANKADLLNRVGVVFYKMEEYDSALTYFEAALQESVNRRDLQSQAVSNNNVGYALNKLKAPVADEIKAWEAAWDLFENNNFSVDYREGIALHLARAYDRSGDNNKANEFYKKVLVFSTPGSDDADTALSKLNLSIKD